MTLPSPMPTKVKVGNLDFYPCQNVTRCLIWSGWCQRRLSKEPKLPYLWGNKGASYTLLCQWIPCRNLGLPTPPSSNEVVLSLLLDWGQRTSRRGSRLSSLPSGKKATHIFHDVSRDHSEQLYKHKFDNLDEWTNSLKKINYHNSSNIEQII